MIISPAKAAEAASVLGLDLKTLSAKELKKAYRRKAKECHPDYHGNTYIETWSRVSWANECLAHWLVHHVPQTVEEPVGEGSCRACKGTGRVIVAKRGFGAPLTMSCVICKGLGTVIQDEDDHD